MGLFDPRIESGIQPDQAVANPSTAGTAFSFLGSVLGAGGSAYLQSEREEARLNKGPSETEKTRALKQSALGSYTDTLSKAVAARDQGKHGVYRRLVNQAVIEATNSGVVEGSEINRVFEATTGESGNLLTRDFVQVSVDEMLASDKGKKAVLLALGEVPDANPDEIRNRALTHMRAAEVREQRIAQNQDRWNALLPDLVAQAEEDGQVGVASLNTALKAGTPEAFVESHKQFKFTLEQRKAQIRSHGARLGASDEEIRRVESIYDANLNLYGAVIAADGTLTDFAKNNWARLDANMQSALVKALEKEGYTPAAIALFLPIFKNPNALNLLGNTERIATVFGNITKAPETPVDPNKPLPKVADGGAQLGLTTKAKVAVQTLGIDKPEAQAFVRHSFQGIGDLSESGSTFTTKSLQEAIPLDTIRKLNQLNQTNPEQAGPILKTALHAIAQQKISLQDRLKGKSKNADVVYDQTTDSFIVNEESLQRTINSSFKGDQPFTVAELKLIANEYYDGDLLGMLHDAGNRAAVAGALPNTMAAFLRNPQNQVGGGALNKLIPDEANALRYLNTVEQQILNSNVELQQAPLKKPAVSAPIVEDGVVPDLGRLQQELMSFVNETLPPEMVAAFGEKISSFFKENFSVRLNTTKNLSSKDDLVGLVARGIEEVSSEDFTKGFKKGLEGATPEEAKAMEDKIVTFFESLVPGKTSNNVGSSNTLEKVIDFAKLVLPVDRMEAVAKRLGSAVGDSFVGKGVTFLKDLKLPNLFTPETHDQKEVERQIQEYISKGEGTTDEKAKEKGFESAYDIPFGYKEFLEPPKALSKMTLKEVMEFQRDLIAATQGKIPGTDKGTSAVGKYQIIKDTLEEGMKALGLREDTVFSPRIQDMMFKHLLEKRGFNDYLEGDITLAGLQNSLAKEWASIPNSKGKSEYGQPVLRS